MIKKLFLWVGAGAAAIAAVYWWLVRPWHRLWGTTSEEAYRVLPGDNLVPEPRLSTTHAISINATPEEVWPWLVQMGQGRGGFYTYTQLENWMDLDIQNADSILPEHQELALGDTIPLSLGPNSSGLPVAMIEPGQYLVLHGDSRLSGSKLVDFVTPDDFLNMSWGFYLFPQPDGTTRLIERWKTDYSPKPGNQLAYYGLLEPGAFVMQRGMLLGIKERAEGRL